MKKRILLLLLIILCFISLDSKGIVFPFQIDTQSKASLWLGRAASFYTTAMLRVNNENVFTDLQVEDILNINQIRFPYSITKATMIRLALENKADYIICGEVSSDKNMNVHNLKLKSYYIDLKTFSQKHFPVVRGDVKGFFEIIRSDSRSIVRHVTSGAQLQLPDLNMSLQTYELLIKGLLRKDVLKKIDLLEKGIKKNSSSDIFNFRLALLYLEKGDLKSMDRVLKLIKKDFIYKEERTFLKALLQYQKGEYKKAADIFAKLYLNKDFVLQSANNLGVIYARTGDPVKAEEFFRFALSRRYNPVVFMNFIKFLIDEQDKNIAFKNLVRALRVFPFNRDLHNILGSFMSGSQDREKILTVFQNYIQEYDFNADNPEIKYRLTDPFRINKFRTAGVLIPFQDIEGYIKEKKYKEAFERGENLLEENPFVPELYHLLSRVLYKEKRYHKALMYAEVEWFLKKSPANLLLRHMICKKVNDQNKADKIREEAGVHFPDNKQLLKKID